MMVFNEIEMLFEGCGGSLYFGEPVTQLEHALQTAALAEADGAATPLVIAALLHDVGHLLFGVWHVSGPQRDLRHEMLGSEWLALRFPPEVGSPVRLHVEAKRYLCYAESSYVESLSRASKQSLELQGGPFTPIQAERFLDTPFSLDAIKLRRWDDRAKVCGKRVPELACYRERLKVG
jgi:gamma-butyrobetaine dioxygenase